MQFLDKIITCKYDDSFTDTIVDAIQNTSDKTGYLGVQAVQDSIADNATGAPEPLVGVPSGDAILYGAVVTVNTATQRCGVLTSGIVPFNKGSNTANTDLDNQPVGVKCTANGNVAPSAATLQGTGLLIGRGGDSSSVLWVDLDKDPAVAIS